MRKNNGITLVALIITIIVLLILAGVTISLVLGDNGILNRAKNSGVEYTKSSIKEEIELGIADIAAELAAKNPTETLTKEAIINHLPDRMRRRINHRKRFNRRIQRI